MLDFRADVIDGKSMLHMVPQCIFIAVLLAIVLLLVTYGTARDCTQIFFAVASRQCQPASVRLLDIGSLVVFDDSQSSVFLFPSCFS